MTLSRRDAARGIFYSLVAGSALLSAQEYGRARDLVAHVEDDLQHAQDFYHNNDKERDRYRDVRRKLSEFDRDLRAGHFDKGKLDSAIDDLKEVVRKNTLEVRDRDALAADLSDLRTMRDERR